jgi:O-antigen ligase/polysaccharide polymerase Wzy-like membrane protein
VVSLQHIAVWRELRSKRFALLLITLAFCLVRARDQPSINVTFGSTQASIVPADILLAVLALVVLWTIARSSTALRIGLAPVAAAAFCLLILVTGAANGASAFVSGAKVVELAALALGVVVLLRTAGQFEAIVDVLILFTAAADVVGVFEFMRSGGRQASFLGEHDFAALATLPLLYGLARVLVGDRGRRTVLTIVLGALGCILGAALASLLGLYLGAAALVAVAAVGKRLTLSRLAVVTAVVAVVTAGTLVIRAGDLGFLQSWFGKPASRPGQYAASWSQRLIYAYVGEKVFTAHPLLGTGWYGELPPREFTAYLPAARARFPDQPASYFPPADKPFIPQQAWDQILYELGIVGALTMLALLTSLSRAAVRAARTASGVAASIPAAWLAASIGALAGEGLFGGTPLAATFWLVAGVVLALSAATWTTQ